MKQNLPKELLKSEWGEKEMNWYVSQDRGGKKERVNFNKVQTGSVNKEFQGVAPLKPNYGKPQSQIMISQSLHQTRSHTNPPITNTVKFHCGHLSQNCAARLFG